MGRLKLSCESQNPWQGKGNFNLVDPIGRILFNSMFQVISQAKIRKADREIV